MGLFKTLILGRDNGIRAGLKKSLLGGPAVDTSPDSSYSAPNAASMAPPPGERSLGLSPEAPKDVTPPEGCEVVLHKDALKPGEVVEIIIAGTSVAVANVEGTHYAVTNTCPHAGGPLGEGDLEGTTLTCPYHGWGFDVTDGTCQTTQGVKIETYEVKIEKDAVCVRL